LSNVLLNVNLIIFGWLTIVIVACEGSIEKRKFAAMEKILSKLSTMLMTVNDLSVYGDKESAELSPRLSHVNLTISPGEWIVVVGVNGSGKSTLVRILAGLYPAEMVGEVARGFAGEAASPIVLQQPRAQLFGETPREEVMFALEWKGIEAEEIPLLTEEALVRTGLMVHADEPWERLSGGQQQLAAIAAATATATPLIILDEVTSMLDEANRSIVMDQARELHRNGTAVIWVTQRLDELELDTRVVALGEGSVVYDGRAQDFLYGIEGEASPCERCGLRLPYMAAFARELKRLELAPVGASTELPFDADGIGSQLGQTSLSIAGLKWRRGSEDKGERGGEVYDSSDLQLLPGTITVLMGPNGAGKSTLLEKLAGLRHPEQLQIKYGSESLWRAGFLGKKRLNSAALRQYSYACQSPEEGLFARSVLAELDYSLRPYVLSASEQEEHRTASLSAVGWDSSWLSRDPYTMSGGERRRCALAAVFVTPAPWLLLDEPTAGLDGDGHERVAEQLRLLKRGGTGVLLVSHDSDWALSLADQVIILSTDGSMRLCNREQLLSHPEWLEEATMKLPDWLINAHLLWRKGVSSDKVWIPTVAAAEQVKLSGSSSAMEMEYSQEQDERIGVVIAAAAAGIDRKVLKGEFADHREAGLANNQVTPRRKQPKQHRLTGFDPRAVWLAYIVLSMGLFLLTSWFAIAWGGAVVAAILIGGAISLRRWRGLIINYVVFSLITSFIFALGSGGDAGIFQWGSFVAILFSFVRTMLVLLLGLAIPLVMTPLSLRRSLTQMISFRGKTPQWAQRLILMVTLMMRFVPELLTLWERFTKIFLARGKSNSSKPGPMIRRLRDVSLPFLLALFRLGDEVALALESRGIGFDVRPTQAIRLKWTLRDYGMVLGAAGLGFSLWFLTSR
jgi:energy-coupling factor transporter ATP-binding protein EcfA2/energy-coupling factor transporter transmembrane protein EcfT